MEVKDQWIRGLEDSIPLERETAMEAFKAFDATTYWDLATIEPFKKKAFEYGYFRGQLRAHWIVHQLVLNSPDRFLDVLETPWEAFFENENIWAM